MTFQEFAAKKVLGVPVLYLAAAFVTVLAVIAWRMKALPTEETPGEDPADGVAGADPEQNGIAGMDDPYGSYETTGTVVVQPTVPAGTDAEAKYENNDEWMKDAAEWLVSSNKATGSDAVTALSKYLNGEDYSFDDGALINAAIKEKGQPPDPVTQIGKMGSPIARRQFTGGSGTHTVQGANDDNFAELAQLYYGNSSALHVNRIVEMNAQYPHSATLAPGTKVNIPYWTTPHYYTVTGKNGDNYFSYIAKKHGLSVAQVQALNPTLTSPLPKGAKVRTQ